MTVRQLHGNVLRNFGAGDARLRLFAFAGLGATFFSADDLESETKFSFGLGGGVKYFPWKAIGFRGHFRYKPTMLNDEDAGQLLRPVRLLSRLPAADRGRRRRSRTILKSLPG